MKKMMLVMLLLLLMGAVSMQAQVRIGDSETPTAGAVLDLNATDYKGGLLLPKVALNTVANLSDLTSPATDVAKLRGLLVYAFGGSVAEGIYVWNGAEWKAIWRKNG
jgi:hypothetical protein